MGKNKKKFIDKKNASRYHLMHRSQRDVGGDMEEGDIGNSGMILWPDPNNNPETDHTVLFSGKDQSVDTMREWRSKLAQVGLLDDYDEQYLKPITGAGTFVGASGKVGSAAEDIRFRSAHAEEALVEITQQFEGIPLTADCMDDDVARALEGDFDEGEFEELDDLFVLDAAKDPSEAGSDQAFDFDAHIAKLMEDARREREDIVTPIDSHAWGQKDQDFFAKSNPLHALHEEEDSLFGSSALDPTPGVVPSLNQEEERALCEQFEQTLAEYDSDDMGDCCDEEIRGERALEGDPQVDTAIDEFLQEREDGFFMQGRQHELADATPKGGSGFSALVGTRMIPVKELDAKGFQFDNSDEKPVEEVLTEARRAIQSPELEPPPEEVLIDGKSYYSMKERNPWDCESILSTYSNLDNNPVTIGAKSRNKKKKAVQPIKLSNKTGLPITDTPVPEEEEDEDTYDNTVISINRGEGRKRGETKEEKKARKALVKKERCVQRQVKKMTKEVYKDELLKRAGDAVSDDVAGKAVFRYS